MYWPWIPEPGKWAQYDFSDGPEINGKKTTLFHYYLPYSKYRIVLHIPDQSLPCVIAALHTCFQLAGGVPRYVLTDNAKTAALHHVATVAVLNAAMVKFAAAYGFTLRTCVPYDPASKGGVERAVRVAKEHLCPCETNLVASYESTALFKEAIEAYNREINATPHSGSGSLPISVLKEEREAFSPLPKTLYVGAFGVERKVESKMPIVRFGRCGYSVPPNMRGLPVYVRQAGDEVVIVALEREGAIEIARHQRGEPYGYVISPEHKDPSHPSGPLARRPVPTNPTEAKFLGLSDFAATWLERAAGRGTPKIADTIGILAKAEPIRASGAISESLALDDFGHATIKALLARAKQATPAVAKSLGNGTSPYAKLRPVS